MEATSDKLVRDVNALVQDAEELIRATSADFGDKTREARARLAGALGVAKDTCRRIEDQASSLNGLQPEALKSNPYPIIGGAFAMGILLGLLAVRRENPD